MSNSVEIPPVCPYCSGRSKLLKSSAELYHGRDYGPVYACLPCQAWVGCHKGTVRPLGRLADAKLRRMKWDAHLAFDPIWKGFPAGPGRGRARRAAYAALAKAMDLDDDHCHIGMFDVEQCTRVIELCRAGAVRLPEDSSCAA